MGALFDLFFDICLLRKGPQHVPDAEILLRLCAVANVVLAVPALAFGTAQMALPVAFGLALLDLALTAGFVYVLLAQRRLLNRFRQTVTALFGVGVLYALASLPLEFWFSAALGQPGAAELPMLLSIALLLWGLTVNGHVLAEALSVSRAIGVCYAFAFFVVARMLIWLLLPGGGS